MALLAGAIYHIGGSKSCAGINYIIGQNRYSFMSVNFELLRRLYPEWFPPSPIHPFLLIFLAIAVLLIIPYLFSECLEVKLAALKKRHPPRPYLNRSRKRWWRFRGRAAFLKKMRPPRPHMNQLFDV